MMNGQIPGYYYDPNKRKYFRIQLNHAVPAGSQYSDDAVKKRKLEEQQEEREILIGRRIAKERFKKSNCLADPLNRLGIEIGTLVTPGFVMQSQQGRAYTSQLRRRELSRFRRSGPELTVTDFVRHDSSGVIVVGINQGDTSQVTICPPYCGDSTKWSYRPAKEALVYADRYRLSSISLSPTGHFLTTLDSGPEGNSSLVLRMLPDPELVGAYPWPLNRTNQADSIQEKATMWCSSPCPTGDRPLFAIGTSDGLYTLRAEESHWKLFKRHLPRPETIRNNGSHRWLSRVYQDITTVEWLTSDTIVSGLRNSGILLNDLRSSGWAARLQHPHAVSKIRKVDEHRLVVAGYKSLQMYDLRYPRNGIQPTPRPNRPGHTSTKAYITFPNYESDLRHSIDINRELGLLASCTNDHKLQFYSLADGSLFSSPASDYQHPQPISRILFENGKYPLQDGQAPRLLVSSGNVVEEWKW